MTEELATLKTEGDVSMITFDDGKANVFSLAMSQTIEKLYLDLQTLNFEARLPLLDLALPRIKAQPAERIAYFDGLLEQLATCDNRLELFEYALLRIFRGYMQAATSPAVGQGWRHPLASKHSWRG